MIDIGFAEICVIFILLLFVIGPDELPQFLFKAGRFMRKINQLWQSVDSDLKKNILPEKSISKTKEKTTQKLDTSNIDNDQSQDEHD